MKTLRTAALAALFTVAPPAFAQEAQPASPPAPAPEVASPAAPAAEPAAPAAAAPPAAPAAATPPAAPAAAKPAQAGPKPPTVTGWVNFQLTSTDAPSPASDVDTFELRRARIGVRGDLTPNLGYVAVFDAADTTLKDAFGVLKNLAFAPGLELRLGQQKTPFGYEQQESDHRLLWVNTSYVVGALARASTVASPTATSDSRDVGVALLGRWPLRGGIGAKLAVAATNGAGPGRRDDLNQKNLWGRLAAFAKVARASIEVGGSTGDGRQLAGLGANARFDGVGVSVDDLNVDFRTYGGDVTLDTGWVFAAAEYVQSDRELLNRATQARTALDARGWYAGAYGRTPWNVGPIVRYERFDRNRDVDGEENERLTLGAYADITPVNGRLVLNWELDRSDAPVRTGDRVVAFAQVVF